MRSSLALLIIFTSIFSLPVFSNAQTLPDLTSTGILSAASSPEFPGPNSQVRVTLSSFSTDLNRATITWYTNGKLSKQAVGLVTFEFKTGAVGTRTEISAVAKKQEGGNLTKTLTFAPAEIDMLWQANTYVPPLYKGRSLKSSEATTRVTAIANFIQNSRRVSNANLVFEWKLNGNPLLDKSGPGKSSIDFKGAAVFGRDIIELTVSTLDKSIISKKIGIAPVIEPEIVFYHEQELGGTDYGRALSNQEELTLPEVIIRAVPFHVSLEEYLRGSMKLEWTVNGKGLPDSRGEGRDLLVLQNGSGDRSRALITASISNPGRLLQEAVGSINLTLNGGLSSNSGDFFEN